MNRKVRVSLLFGVLILLLILMVIININTGSVDVDFRRIMDIIVHGNDGSNESNIILTIRLPRILAAFILGGALGVAGFELQSFFNNPIAGPYVLGISSGAKLTVAVLMIAFLNKGIYLGAVDMILAAFVGALLSMGIVLLISFKIRRMSILIICGIMIGYICSAITEFLVTFADDSNIVNLHNWSLGSFSGTNMNNVKVMAVVVFGALIISFLLSKPLSALRLGESYAASMGVSVKALQISLIVISSLLSACVTAFAGPISFVGIAVPHLIRITFKTDSPYIMIPASFLGGGLFCLICDLIARCMFAPVEMSIGSVTAILGAPVVIALMISKKGMKRTVNE